MDRPACKPAPGTPAAPVFDPALCEAYNRKWLLAAAILASALGFIDGSVVAIALPAMRETLGASLFQAQWISNAYLLTLSALILVGGAMGDRFGLARVFQLGIALFVAASIACALAPDPTSLITARAVQGIGAAAMVPGSLALISRAYPREERGRAIGIWSAASALTTALGPTMGGAVLSLLGPEAWRLIFAVNLPLGGIALLLLWRYARDTRRETAARVDVAGAALATLGLMLMAWGLSGSEHGGAIRQDLTAAGFAAFAGFLFWQARAKTPMMPLSLFGSRVFSAANLLSFFLYFSLTAMLFYLPMTAIGAWGISAFEASLAFVPLSAFIFALSSWAGGLADRVGPGTPIAAGSMLVALAYGVIAGSAGPHSFRAVVLPSMALAGLGMAFVVAPLSAAVMGSVDEAKSGTASGINNAVTRVAGLIAVAVMGALAATAYTAAGGTQSFAGPGNGLAHLTATSTAFSWVAAICAGLSALSSAIAWIGLRPAPAS